MTTGSGRTEGRNAATKKNYADTVLNMMPYGSFCKMERYSGDIVAFNRSCNCICATTDWRFSVFLLVYR
jgi:hypothetical protein